MDDRRLSTRLTNLWEKLSELHPPPLFAQLNQAAISDIWQQCAVLRVEPSDSAASSVTLVFEFLGDDVRRILSNVKEGIPYMRNSMPPALKKMLADVDAVCESTRTTVTSGTLVSPNNKVLKFRVCLLPFTNQSGAVANIVVGFSWIEC